MHSNSLKDLEVPIDRKNNLSHYTTFQLGGPCEGVLTCKTPQQLKNTVEHFNKTNDEFILIGGGSNLLISDQGIGCYVIRYYSDVPLIERIENDLVVSGSTNLDALAYFAADQGLEGLNCTTGIPGTVGGAVLGNAGAFGKQIGDCLVEANLLSLTGQEKNAGAKDLKFSYRHSILKVTDDIVSRVRLSLKGADKNFLLQEREHILKVRREKHPNLLTHPCAGSFFRNIEPTSNAGKRQAAGWFLDQAGSKNLIHGGAGIFNKHANIIVKSQGCKSQDVYELSKKMSALVKQKFGFDLVREVRLIGSFANAPKEKARLIW